MIKSVATTRGVAQPPHYRVVCALIERDGRVLAAQRPPQKLLPFKWEFPGGKLEAGESPEAALVREIREELHLDIVVGAPLPPSAHDYGTFSITLAPFLATIPATAEPRPLEHAAVRWCTARELRDLDWAAADVPVLDHYLARRASEPVFEPKCAPTS
jgi:8-oxo-dGTP diphosphatase